MSNVRVSNRSQVDAASSVTFTIDGEPVSKQRARVVQRDGKSHSFTPAKTTNAEAAIGWLFKAAASAGHVKAGAFGVSATFYLAGGQDRDIDNLLKLVLDGLNKVAWNDDRQVVEVSARKVPTSAGRARSQVCVYRVEQAAS